MRSRQKNSRPPSKAKDVSKVEIDSRIGSKQLLPLLKKLHVPAVSTRLEFGDAALTGNGPDGEVRIGVERKTIYDLLSSIGSGRLSAHQLPGMVKEYDYRWIVVEGLWRPGKDNVIEVWRGGWRQAPGWISYHEVDRYLVTLEVRGGVHVRRTSNLHETAVFLGGLRRWWSKPWKAHRAHLAIQKGVDSRLLGTTLERDILAAKTPKDWDRVRRKVVRRVAQVLPGLGWEKSEAVMKRFEDSGEMVDAGRSEWEEVPGIGKTLGERLPKLLRRGRG
jgi:ERCC4-type nuclease